MKLGAGQLGRLVRFALAGGAGTALYFVTALLAERATGAVFAAHAIAYVVSVSFSYLAQKIFTFGVRGQHRRMGARFAIATAAISVGQLGVVALLNAAHATPTIVFLGGALFYPLASYLIHSLWTFREAR